MKYPKFLKKNDLIGIMALSSGAGDKLLEVKVSLNHLKEYFHLIVTPTVYGGELVSASKEERIKDLNNLLMEDVKLITNIRGGDFLYETLDDIDYLKIKEKNIWVMGYSDPSSLLYILTTKYDLATIYGFNGKSYDDKDLLEYELNNLEIIKGNLIRQTSFMDRETISINGDFISRGIIIGGCLDVLRYLFGTSYDHTLEFLKKYQKYHIIWYFDIFSMGSMDVYLTLLQMQKMGYFKYSDTFIFGSVMYPKVECGLEYEEVFKKVFPNQNIIFDANIGHVKPCFTIINGSLVTISYEKDKMSLSMELLNEDNS